MCQFDSKEMADVYSNLTSLTLQCFVLSNKAIFIPPGVTKLKMPIPSNSALIASQNHSVTRLALHNSFTTTTRSVVEVLPFFPNVTSLTVADVHLGTERDTNLMLKNITTFDYTAGLGNSQLNEQFPLFGSTCIQRLELTFDFVFSESQFFVGVMFPPTLQHLGLHFHKIQRFYNVPCAINELVKRSNFQTLTVDFESELLANTFETLPFCLMLTSRGDKRQVLYFNL
jgi:Leucine-rich repeat (LRR) protein